MTALGERRCTVVPGEGYVGRWPGVVLLVPPGPTAGATIDALLAAFDGHDPTPTTMRDALGAVAESVEGAAIAAVLDGDGGLWAVVTGPAMIDGGPRSLTGAPGTIAEDVLPDDAPITLRSAAYAIATVDDRSALRGGLVPGSQARLRVDPAGPTVTPPTPGDDVRIEIPGSADFDLVDFAQPTDTRDPLPIVAAETTGEIAPVLEPDPDGVEVLGVLCSRDHFNSPLASYCVVCGISMIHRTAVQVPGIRPTLGFVVFDDGSTYALDRGYVIGRDPAERDDLVPLPADDADGTVSREHAELRLDKWDVVFADLGSTNGSFVWDSAANRWHPVPVDTPVVLAPGTIGAVGRRTFTFESVHRTSN